MTDSSDPPSPCPALPIERRGACVQVTLNRPEKPDTLNRRSRSRLTGAMHDPAADDAVRVVIFAGAGRAAIFAGAGMHLNEFSQPRPEEGAESSQGLTVFQALEGMPKPLRRHGRVRAGAGLPAGAPARPTAEPRNATANSWQELLLPLNLNASTTAS